MTTNIKGADVSIFCILDGHGGEFAAVFGKEHLMEKLTKKIVEAIDISSGKVSPLLMRRNSLITNVNDQQEPNEKKEEKQTDDSSQIQRTASQRRKLKKTLSSDNDCNPAISNCNQEQDSFLGKLSSIRITKESFMKKDKIVKPTEYDAGHYVDRNSKINFGKMVTDLVLLTDFELIEKAKIQVSCLHIQFISNGQFMLNHFCFIAFIGECRRFYTFTCCALQNSINRGQCWRFTRCYVRW